MDAVYVIVRDHYDDEVRVFSSERMLLTYYQTLYPHAKHLRVREYRCRHYQILNYNTPVTGPQTTIFKIVPDEAI